MIDKFELTSRFVGEAGLSFCAYRKPARGRPKCRELAVVVINDRPWCLEHMGGAIAANLAPLRNLRRFLAESS